MVQYKHVKTIISTNYKLDLDKSGSYL